MNDETRFLSPDPEQPDQPDQSEQYEAPEPAPAALDETPPRRTGSHPVQVGQLAMGLVFLAAVGVWALIQSDAVTGDGIRWLLPLPWVIGGGIGLVVAATSSVRRHGVGR